MAGDSLFGAQLGAGGNLADDSPKHLLPKTIQTKGWFYFHDHLINFTRLVRKSISDPQSVHQFPSCFCKIPSFQVSTCHL